MPAIDSRATSAKLAAMTHELAIALAQLNPTVGDIDGNLAQIRGARAEAAAEGRSRHLQRALHLRLSAGGSGAEAGLPGRACGRRSKTLARDTADGGPAMLVGAPWVEDGKLYNAVLLLDGGAGRRPSASRYDLPNYGVFDEKRVFAPAPPPGPVNVRGVRLGVPICEDMWTPDVTETPGRDRRRDPVRAQRLALRARQGRRAPRARRARASPEPACR